MIAAALGLLLLAQTLPQGAASIGGAGSAGDGRSPKGAASIDQRLDKERAAARQLAGREAGLLGKLAEQERQVEIESRAARAPSEAKRSTASASRSDSSNALKSRLRRNTSPMERAPSRKRR